MNASAYAAEVRSALRDLPADSELLEDLDEHLAELAADTGPDLVATLGPPAGYAEQLRRAAGLTAAPRPPRRDPLVGALLRVRETDAVREVVAFLPQLRPAWWVLRGCVAIIALGLLFGGGATRLLPFGLLQVPLIAAAVVVSVRVGRHTVSKPPADGRRVAALVSNAALALVALMVVVGVQQQPVPVYADQSGVPVDASLTTRDGSPITNLYPYSSDGHPLSGVLLYDQQGRPVDNLATYDTYGEVSRVVPTHAPPPPSNAYPQQQRVTGDPTAVTPPPDPLTPSLSAGPTATPAPGPAVTRTPDPGATGSPTSAPGAPSPAAPASPIPTPS